ncbi:MAG: hypothetical protein R3358_10190 [Woeseiaceae bacterium]|nr:hypothetical protein [Woeseiaceae bacterium]
MIRRTTLQLLFGLLGLWAELAGAEPSIEPVCCDWELSAPFYVSGTAYYFDDGNTSTGLHTLSLAAELKLSSKGSPWQTGIFVDRRFSDNSAADGIFNSGGFVKNYTGRWDTSLWIFNHNPPNASSQWVFATRVRYLLAPRHKLGLEVFGLFDDASEPDLLLGYYGDVTDRWSVKLVAGANIHDPSKRILRTELVFQLH